jgi:membrane associated rhomboid family serine protease
MGLYDRDYYRDEPGGSWGEWLDQRGSAVIIGITCAVFFLQLLTSPRSTTLPANADLTTEEIRAIKLDPIRRSCDMHAPAVASGEIWRLFTAYWVHDFRQIIGFVFGMLMVYMIGRLLEPVIGGKEMLVFYTVAGLTTMIVLFAVKWLGRPDGSLVRYDFAASGCAGPVAAIVMLFGLKFWDQPLRLIGDTPIPTWAFLAIFFGVSFAFKLAAPDRIELILTELIGIGTAFVYQKTGTQLARSLRWPARTGRRRTKLKLVPAPDDEPDDPTDAEPVVPVSRGAPTGEPVDEQLEAKLDRVLDKVSRTGQDSLTADEKSILHRASEVYKKRRGR